MSDNETPAERTYGEVMADTTNTGPVASTSRDTIKGWNDRRKSNNQVISTMVPFVQLIGLFDRKEYDKMFSWGSAENRTSVVFDDESITKSASYDEKYTINESLAFENIEKQIAARTKNIYIIKSADHSLNVTQPIDGIIMAEAVSQAKDPSGGIGITDLQVDYGKSNVLGSRKFVLRMTINDPAILDERFEYSKLATFNSQFLIIYGWSNPEAVPGYDAAMSPPRPEVDPNEPSKERLIVPIRNLGNGGYWSAGVVNISKYDFGFNEMGKLEINIELRDASTLGLSSTIISSVARQFKQFIDTGALDRMITSADGSQFTLKEALHERQLQLNKMYSDPDSKMSYDEYTSQWAEAIKSLNDVVTLSGESASTANEVDENSYMTSEDVQEMQEAAREPQKGYPWQNAMYTYKQIFATVIDNNPEGGASSTTSGEVDQIQADLDGVATSSVPTKQVVSYEKKAAYYYLGALMDSISLCMASSQGGIEASRVPSFYYRDISKDSKLSTSFQNKLKSVNRATGMEERIQEAIIRLKERFLPPPPVEDGALAPDAAEPFRLAWARSVIGQKRFYTYSAASKEMTDGKNMVSGVRPAYEGMQTPNKTRVINALFPAPPVVGQMAGAPMRSHFVFVNTNDYGDILEKKNLEPVGTVWCVIPDWKQEISFDTEGNEVVSSGHKDGYDPLNPSEYRGAYPRPLTVTDSISGRNPSSEDFEERSQAPYGRGGRFWMIIEMKKDEYTYRMILDYATWRINRKGSWNLLQKKWNNLYREYLAAYYESIIRKRINEIQPLGIPIEAIFKEVLDLDYLTGFVYENGRWGYKAGSNYGDFLNGWDDVFKKNVGSFDLDEENEKLDATIVELRREIAENTIAIEGHIPPPPAPSAVEEEPASDGGGGLGSMIANIRARVQSLVVEGELVIPAAPEGYDTWGEFRTAHGGLRKAIAELVEKINNIKIEIEQLTGGSYEKNRDGDVVTEDVMGNIIMLRFKNFMKVVPSETEFANEQVLGERDPETMRPIERVIGVFKAEIEYEYQVDTPKVKEEWVLWKEYKVPTNNFQNRWDNIQQIWDDELNKAEKWKQENVYAYETGVLAKVEADKKSLEKKLLDIKEYQNTLAPLYEEYQEKSIIIAIAEAKINKIEATKIRYAKFFNEEKSEIKLSIYDDTSDFDGDGIEVPSGRDEPMHLTTKVAQQWAKRFQKCRRRGAIDVRNYGPPQGGKPYVLPTNNYQFKFAIEKRGHSPMGQPLRVLDPEIFEGLGGFENSINRLQTKSADLLSNLSFGAGKDNTDADSLIYSKDMPYEDVQIGPRVTEKGYKNWSLFGSPGIPYQNGNNKWGFKYGPPYERLLAGDETEQLGGNYVRTYKDFLNLFGMGHNPEWPDSLRLVGKWPMPMDTRGKLVVAANRAPGEVKTRLLEIDDAKMLMENNSAGIPVYTTIDQVGNILVDDDNGWYHPSGWYLDFAGEEIFLYPSREKACKINNTSEDVTGTFGPTRPGGVLTVGLPLVGNQGNNQRIGFSPDRGHRPRSNSDGKPNGRTPRRGQQIWDAVVDAAVNYWDTHRALISGDFKSYLKGMRDHYVFVALKTHPAYHLYGAMRNHALAQMTDGEPVNYEGTKPSWGMRIGGGEHCMNLTLDMKRSMILNRNTVENETRFLGRDDPAGDGNGPNFTKIDWSQSEKKGRYRYLKGTEPPELAPYTEYVYPDGVKTPAPGATLDGPRVPVVRGTPYSNPEYPYGTGIYHWRNIQHGPYSLPTRLKGWADWGDLLYLLGSQEPETGYGFFTQVDNSNYTSCVVQPSGEITDGLELNDGFVKFIIENVFAPLPGNRRCGATNDHRPIEILGDDEGDDILSWNAEHRINDVTYGDLFGPLRSDAEDDAPKPAEAALDPTSFGNIDNFLIENVKSIPIRREVVDNLINKNNTNMSMTQFIGEIFRPGAIGVNSGGNQQMAIRQGEDGTFEVFSPNSIDWQKQADKYAYLWNPGIGREEEAKRRFPEDIIMLDFKAKDSLIENLDMKSTFDPLIARAFRNAAIDFAGDTDALINFLSYKDIAPDLIEFLEINEPTLQPKPDDNGNTTEPRALIYDKVTNKVTLNKSLIMNESGNGAKNVVLSVVTKFLQSNQQRLNAMRNIMQATGGQTEDGTLQTNNYATQLMSNYMRKTTITIHGTTNIAPFQKVIVKGIMPNLEGMYLITNTRESITPQGFQTILEGSLIRPPSKSARGENDTHVPAVGEQRDVDKLGPRSEADPSGQSGRGT